ncbi:class I SAM-dependent methyltransferase [Pseudalkalibacillus sp. A8]|uniref:class I SAM-dependent methyltransferase n=1 Tax=Pseudalkalibacillus sp. A8 TaxID=3382641 RepID=UPI0038B41BE4
MGFLEDFSMQFRHPRGFWGKVTGHILALTTGSRNDWTLSKLNIEPDDHVLEIGFGPGIGIYKCANNIQSGKVIGIDISTTMKEQASRRNRPFIESGKVELKVGTVESLEIPKDYFHKIYSVNSVMFWEDRVTEFEKLFSHLKPGGVIATTYQPMFKGATEKDAIDAEELTVLLEKIGFSEVSFEVKNSSQYLPSV